MVDCVVVIVSIMYTYIDYLTATSGLWYFFTRGL